MGKKLAIKGHPTRGKEVIKLLEMMGGKSTIPVGAILDKCIYVNIEGNILELHHYFNDFLIFTLEEFLEKYPFKVGDVIKFPNNMVEEISEMKWDEKLEDIIYTSVSGWTRPCSVPKNTNNKANMNMNENKVESTGFMQMGKTVSVIFNSENYEDEVELQLGDYEIVVRDNKTYAVLKKTKYPKTYEECCNVMYGSVANTYGNCIIKINDGYKGSLIQSFQRLIFYRDAYWKIAGEEMGLGKPWEPDWNEETDKFTISNKCNKIYLNNTAWYAEVLSFPTAEMRDVFYENFKDFIEQCKELL